ncbi:hypothetical protein AWW19_21385 [Salmonella enterica subsp. enterica serovar Brunei]|nr:hypothetical protein [Salmonella enterica subsp. enterica serovar Brunei]ECY3918090.1 hypothetical protein [Salmonella enterica subsp. enterica serovar Brunei]ECZ3662745.1 hypothetical protein [Salmonella enterica subsp. enterica serovar Brunei]EDT7292795.1 hypothetical protein [Salmonella enterica subsp. enterica]EDW1420538.1 hypothetical protein [Salmonella enterica subsp. enterica]
MSDKNSTFSYNKGLAKEPDITLDKVTHIDLDSLFIGMEIGLFATVTSQGFMYLTDIGDVTEAYKAGCLYAISGNY